VAQQQNYGEILSKILVVIVTGIFLTGCSSPRLEPEIKTVTKIEKIQIPTVARPKPTQLNDVRVYVVNKDNYEQFVKEFKEENGDLAYVALSMKDYENLALNIADLRRFILQQTDIIVYYEDAVTDKKEEVK
jgi:hypothetical protein